MRFQPRSGITPALDYIPYRYVPIPCLLWYSSPRLNQFTGSSSHLGIANLLPIICSHCTSSYDHIVVARLHTSITDCPVFCTHFCPRPLLYVPLSPLPTPFLLQYFIQCYPKLCICHLLTPPYVPPMTSTPISLLSCTHHKNRPQRQPLYHLPLLSSYVVYR